jgi:hypothetical protein
VKQPGHVQTPPEQTPPLTVQSTQLLPLLPQAVLPLPGEQLLPFQQPVQQLPP